jgi:hypothetical protein
MEYIFSRLSGTAASVDDFSNSVAVARRPKRDDFAEGLRSPRLGLSAISLLLILRAGVKDPSETGRNASTVLAKAITNAILAIVTGFCDRGAPSNALSLRIMVCRQLCATLNFARINNFVLKMAAGNRKGGAPHSRNHTISA